MVNSASIVCICLAMAATALIPAGIIIWYCIRHKSEKLWFPALIGALGFFIPQILIRVPILNMLSMNAGFTEYATNHYLVYALSLAATAGLFEVSGRFGAAKILDKKGITLHQAMAAGLGHGCIESILIAGLQYLNLLLYAVMINTGSFDAIAETAAQSDVDPAQFEALKDSLINDAPLLYLVGIWERGMAIIVHLFMSMLVFYFVMKKRPVIGVLLSFLFHTLIDSMVVIQGLSTPYLGEVISKNAATVIIEVMITVAAAFAVCGIIRLRKKWGAVYERCVECTG